MKGYKMIATMNDPKPRTRAQIIRAMKKTGIQKDLPPAAIKTLADIAFEFDCIVRDTAEELVKVRAHNQKLRKLLERTLTDTQSTLKELE